MDASTTNDSAVLIDARSGELIDARQYFYDHRDAMVTLMKASFSALEADRAAQPFSRDELLRRKVIEES